MRRSFFDSKGAEITRCWLFHSLSVSTHTVGMFVGMLHPGRMPSQEIAFQPLVHAAGDVRRCAGRGP